MIDTHCHLDAAEFDADRNEVIQAALDAGVKAIVIPAVAPSNFDTVRELAHATPGGSYALGIHPMCVMQCADDALEQLREALLAWQHDSRLVAVGEIGLDRFEPALVEAEAWERQWRFYETQLRLAKEFDLPVLLHVRRAVDFILKGIRQIGVSSGIAHAFNGSRQQADELVKRQVALGVGGAMTFTRARQIRRIAHSTPLQHLVLETDAPDIPPAWLHGHKPRNQPAEVAGVASALAELRGVERSTVVAATGSAALAHLPRLKALPELAESIAGLPEMR